MFLEHHGDGPHIPWLIALFHYNEAMLLLLGLVAAVGEISEEIHHLGYLLSVYFPCLPDQQHLALSRTDDLENDVMFMFQIFSRSHTNLLNLVSGIISHPQ
jgi:hypothetical protein